MHPTLRVERFQPTNPNKEDLGAGCLRRVRARAHVKQLVWVGVRSSRETPPTSRIVCRSAAICADSLVLRRIDCVQRPSGRIFRKEGGGPSARTSSPRSKRSIADVRHSWRPGNLLRLTTGRCSVYPFMPCTRSRCSLAASGKLSPTAHTASAQPHARRRPELGLPGTASSRWVTTCSITSLYFPGSGAVQMGQTRGWREKRPTMSQASDLKAPVQDNRPAASSEEQLVELFNGRALFWVASVLLAFRHAAAHRDHWMVL
jgi:hypothetical protein